LRELYADPEVLVFKIILFGSVIILHSPTPESALGFSLES